MKEKVDVTGVPETMLQTLYARAKETKKSEMSWPVETVWKNVLSGRRAL